MFSVAVELGSAASAKYYAPLPVSPSLRGYAEESELRLPRDPARRNVSITALALRWCPTGRDLYLDKAKRSYAASWPRDVLGRVIDPLLVALHKAGLDVLEDAFEAAVQNEVKVDLDAAAAAIREKGRTAASQVLAEWEFKGWDKTYRKATLDSFAEAMAPGKGPALVEGTTNAVFALVDYETKLLFDYAAARRATSADWMAEVRATLTRLQTGLRLDGGDSSAAVFGLSDNVCPDFVYAVTLIGDMKAGPDPEFYDGVATGYVIFAEYVLQRRINTAALLAVDLDLDGGSVRSHKVRILHPDDAQRMRWVTQRDSALQTFALSSEPLHPTDTQPCKTCPYRSACWVDGTVDGTPILDGKPVVRPTLTNGVSPP